MYSTYIQRIEIALLSDPWCIQLTLNTDSRRSNTDKYSLTICGGVVVSEFSVAWGKRGEGGQGREGVQLPDSLMDEAVLQSAGPRLETPQSPPWWQQTEEAVCRVGGITCNAEGFAGETGAVVVLEGGERDTNDLRSLLYVTVRLLQSVSVCCAAVRFVIVALLFYWIFTLLSLCCLKW